MHDSLAITIGILIMITVSVGLGWTRGEFSVYKEYKDVICTKPDLTVDQRYKLRRVCNFK